LLQCLYVKTNRRPFLNRKPQADRANHAPDLLRHERRDQQKRSAKTSNINKQQKQRSHHATWNMRHAWDTHSTHNTGKLLAATWTPSPDNKTSTGSNNNNSKIPCYFGGFPKRRGCLLFVLWPWPKQDKLSLFSDGLCNDEDDHQMDSILDSELDKLALTLADVIIENQFLILTIVSSHH
jgi:hypothetical protein